MTPRLRSMTVVIALMSIGGVTYQLATRQPPDITLDEMRDAGANEQRIDRWVAVCPEKITAVTRNYLRRNGYGDFKPGSIHRIARVIWEYQDPDGGRTALNPSLVSSLIQVDGGALLEDGGVADEDAEIDNSNLFRTDDCYRIECNAIPNELRLLSDAGFRHRRVDDTEQPWCNAAVRRGRVTPPCVLPNCWTLADGGWDDNAVVDCRGTGPYGEQPGGGPRWRGCNVTPVQFSTGTACLPVECSVVAGDNPIDVLR